MSKWWNNVVIQHSIQIFNTVLFKVNGFILPSAEKSFQKIQDIFNNHKTTLATCNFIGGEGEAFKYSNVIFFSFPLKNLISNKNNATTANRTCRLWD